MSSSNGRTVPPEVAARIDAAVTALHAERARLEAERERLHEEWQSLLAGGGSRLQRRRLRLRAARLDREYAAHEAQREQVAAAAVAAGYEVVRED